MSRCLPTECHHGTIVDWGDFGECQDCDEHDGEECPNLADCPQCDATVTEKFLKIIRSLLPSRRQHYED